MSTRRKIERILKSKNLRAEITYDGAGRTLDEWGWWTVQFDEESRAKLLKYNPGFQGTFEFTEPEDGLEDLAALVGAV